MGVRFSATSIDECVEKASSELNISMESLEYKIIKEERRFFKKIVEIEVIEDKEKSKKIEDEVRKEVAGKVASSGAKIEDGKIIITNFEESNDIITVKSCEGVILLINGERFDYITPVTEDDNIEYKFEEVKGERKINISITSDKMEAYITTKYVPENNYELIDQGYCKNLVLKKKKISEKYPPHYTINELQEILKSKDIRYGIIKEELENICNEYNVKSRLIAKGECPKDDIPDEIKVFFKDSNELINYDSEQKIDYRNRYSICNVKSGDVLAEKIPGKEGKDGIDVLGKTIKRKIEKSVFLKAGEGCSIKENKVVAISEGKPTFKGNIFAVHKLYKIEDVNLETGNINFVGDVEITGTVNEGMEVTSGNELFVQKNVEYAKLNAGGQVNINGNVIKSTITAGCKNVKIKQYLEDLIRYKTIIDDLISSCEQIKHNNLLGPRRDGEIIKILIENKFKSLPKISSGILNYNVSQGIQEAPITTFIINRLIGIGPLKLKSVTELNDFVDIVENEIEEIEDLIIVPIDIYLDYSQASTIEASGNVIITGKGQYTSNITALNNIEFVAERAACRGGVLSAGSEIKLKTVGSTAGVGTKLQVPKHGRITAEIAYNNTLFCFGERQRLLEVSSKNVEAYVDGNGEIAIDKFIL